MKHSTAIATAITTKGIPHVYPNHNRHEEKDNWTIPTSTGNLGDLLETIMESIMENFVQYQIKLLSSVGENSYPAK